MDDCEYHFELDMRCIPLLSDLIYIFITVALRSIQVLLFGCEPDFRWKENS